MTTSLALPFLSRSFSVRFLFCPADVDGPAAPLLDTFLMVVDARGRGGGGINSRSLSDELDLGWCVVRLAVLVEVGLLEAGMENLMVD